MSLYVHVLALQEIRRLPNVHPVPGQLHLVKFLLRGHLREDFPFDRSGSIFDSANQVQVEQVESGIDFVADEDLRLLDKSLDLSIFFRDDHTVPGRLVNLGHDNSPLAPMGLMEIDQILQRVFANYVRVEHEEEA